MATKKKSFKELIKIYESGEHLMSTLEHVLGYGALTKAKPDWFTFKEKHRGKKGLSVEAGFDNHAALFEKLELMNKTLKDPALSNSISYLEKHLDTFKVTRVSQEGDIDYEFTHVRQPEPAADETVRTKIEEILQTDFVAYALASVYGIATKELQAQFGELHEQAKQNEEQKKALALEKKELNRKKRELEKKEKLLLKREAKKKANGVTKISRHAMSQLFSDKTRRDLFSEEMEKVEEFIKDARIDVNQMPDRYGAALTDCQQQVFLGVLKGFTNTNYQGDELLKKDGYVDPNGQSAELMEKTYRNITQIPVLKLSQSELIELSGYSKTHSDKTDVIEAINFLATKQFCFYWRRSKHDEKGRPMKKYGNAGDIIKEEVMEVGTLLRVKYVRDENTGNLIHYEIHPAAVLLDQVDKYFLLIRNDWREEIKKVTGRYESKYTYSFALWLQLQYEQIRRGNQERAKRSLPAKPYVLVKAWEDIAVALNMPESLYKKKRKDALRAIERAYKVAIDLGYLLKVDNNGATDELHLNESYFKKSPAGMEEKRPVLQLKNAESAEI